MNDVIDLRSDTLSVQCSRMRELMSKAEVGDDVFGEDPSVNRLQDIIKTISGKEAVLFTPTCTQANLIATLTHCERGDEYIAGDTSHLYYWELGGASVVGGVQAQTVPFLEDGRFDLGLVELKIKPRSLYYPQTKLLCLENTCEGRVLSLEYVEEAYKLCQKHGIKLHIDGARIFNAMEYLNVPLGAFTRYCDSMSICFSKGLGAPIGSVLCLSEELYERAVRIRKMLGGGMRQSGMLATACQFAMENNMHYLKEDRENAENLAKELGDLELPFIEKIVQNTNMIFFYINADLVSPLIEYFKANNISIGRYIQQGKVRLVFHNNVKARHISRIVEVFKLFAQEVAFALV